MNHLSNDDQARVLACLVEGKSASFAKHKNMKCPCCGKAVSKSHFSCQSGAKGGAAGTGKSKARSSEQARANVMKRWEKRKDKNDTV
jgi:hypothetical protein